jgi:hypothetical protein
MNEDKGIHLSGAETAGSRARQSVVLWVRQHPETVSESKHFGKLDDGVHKNQREDLQETALGRWGDFTLVDSARTCLARRRQRRSRALIGLAGPARQFTRSASGPTL